ncbi:50S ribosomal protein L7/L12 [Neisseria elongata subsp. glycolytica ATCC 29315]|uniref:50S ribosomal protein L7/L12 n=1 Tax=Neisseria elongata subsp. glycolytica ATCC 29315 TaxID=546263 RepID=D4DPM6_NEIEG|nr:hypothetical protein [Neisseria elongata]AJE19019.1 50S ribosomal protein L7/L12 [Neisseria elongata subsp. glycolytica ATCC 29315]EFE50334.1 hypothetical protein NEIELOOT_01013 [Neisseria elongata subsp. glycolytica ATCC 29315]SQH50920.1 Uncharacterised protein [Neisseria elongata subsp. glycolytica]
MTTMNIAVLIAVLVYGIGSYIHAVRTMLDADKIAALLLGNPEVAAWLKQNLTGSDVADIKAIRLQFGLGLREAKSVLDKYRA